MTTDVRIFGMHKAGTSFLMKALSHFCHRNKVALASSPFGMIPLQAYAKWENGMGRDELKAFLSYEPDLIKRIEAFSKADIKTGDAIGDRLAKAEIYSIGDNANDKRVLFYRNTSVPVWEMDDSPAIRVIRNPLSIVKSAYFSHKKTHSTLGWSRLEKQREILNDVSRDEGMWKTYEFMREDLFFHMTEGPLQTLLNWPDDVSSLDTVRMEDMTTAPSSFLLKLWRMLGGEMETLNFVPPEILTFEHQSGGRKQGEIDPNNHLRSGDPEEWREILPKDLIKQIRKDYGPLLKAYYPTAMTDRKKQVAVRIPPKETLSELEAAYTALMQSRKETATAKASVENWEGRLQTVLKQRDQIVASHESRFENMKTQRDEALQAVQTAQEAASSGLRELVRKTPITAAIPAPSPAPSPKVQPKELADLQDKLDRVKAQRDKAVKAYSTILARFEKLKAEKS